MTNKEIAPMLKCFIFFFIAYIVILIWKPYASIRSIDQSVTQATVSTKEAVTTSPETNVLVYVKPKETQSEETDPPIANTQTNATEQEETTSATTPQMTSTVTIPENVEDSITTTTTTTTPMVPELEGEHKVVEVKMMITAYCPCKTCNGKWAGTTASQKPPTPWHTIAAGPKYAFGTQVYIPYFADKPNGGMFVVEDRGTKSANINRCIDVLFNSHDEAKAFGRKELTVYIYE